MQIEDECLLQASRETVWAMLNDVEILRVCIPGCEALEEQEGGRMSAVVTTKIGPIKARFAGEVQLSSLVPPTSYTIQGEGKGGIAGFAKGRADVVLSDHPDGTLLRYSVDVAIGGKIAQLGGRLIASTSKKLSEQFFQSFALQVRTARPDRDEDAAGDGPGSEPA